MMKDELNTFIVTLDKSLDPVRDLKTIYNLADPNGVISNDLKKIESSILSLQKNKVQEYITNEVTKINTYLKSIYSLNSNMVLYQLSENKIYLIDRSTIVLNLDGKSASDQLELFENNKSEIEKNAKNLIKIMKQNLTQFKKLISNIETEVKTFEFLDSKMVSTEVVFESADCRSVIGRFYYNKNYIAGAAYNLLHNLKDGADTMIMDDLKAKYFKHIKDLEATRKKQQTINVNRLVDSINRKLNISRKISLFVQKDLETPYDLSRGLISDNFDVTNDRLVNKLIKEINNKFLLILQLENCTELLFFTENIVLGKKYFFVLKKETTINEDTYKLFDCKAAHNKRYFHVFKNGEKLFGNERKRAIKLLGY